MKFKYVLALETSCDDTSVAIVRHDGFVEKVLSADQDLVHEPFGGVVPEIASRNHTLQVLPLVEKCLNESTIKWEAIDGIAVTSRPGLVGSLIVGLVTAKTLSLTQGIPFLGVNHLEGHLLAPFLKDNEFSPPDEFAFPYVALAISGGHTQLYWVESHGKYRVLGKTLDDAAGEAFDKFAKLVGLGFPGGVAVDRLAKSGKRDRFHFPRALIHEKNLNFSFSGLKTAAQNEIAKMSEKQIQGEIQNLCASYQEAIVDALMNKLGKAVEQMGARRAIVTGGVSANSRLREVVSSWAQSKSLQVVIPPIRYCTDNAAMIGYAGILRFNRGEFSEATLAPSPRSYQDDFIEGVSR
ncbi:MAG: tRNA (adenosine(37)-N6)-threonylcarbamoyltransferase complex transferase subunit TsaD [Bdellovibrionales bacterium]|nr:tRNA (adenosine(37)-N6)-threonylcarbamoyltransferase complex transferase subunit TsaD [Bdellovibrionales bacterium]